MTLRKTVLIQIPLLAASTFFSLWVGSSLPDVVPVHWGLTGNVDRYGSRFELLLMGPLLCLLAIGMTFLMRFLGRDQHPTAVNAMYVASAGTSFFFTYLHIILVQNARGSIIDVVQWITVGICGLFVLIGNIMIKVKRNPYVGIRVPWTMSNEPVWRESHRRTGNFWVYGGLGLIVLILFGLPPMAIVISLLLFSLFPIWDSWLVAKRINRGD